jgi:hypothetical protein
VHGGPVMHAPAGNGFAHVFSLLYPLGETLRALRP